MIKKEDLYVRDPFIYKEGDTYYFLGTFRPITNEQGKRRLYLYTSKDLENFEGPYFLFDVTDEFWGEKALWAPELYKYKGKYYIFVTFMGHGIRGTQVLVSDKLLGPYQYLINEPITPKEWDCIDGSLFVENDTPYLIFVRSWTEVVNGHMDIVELTPDLKHRKGEPQILFKARDAKWVCRTREDPRGGVTDGPFVYKKNNIYHMLWSSYRNEIYCTEIATSDNLFTGWKHQEEPFISNDNGHGMIFIDNNKVKCAVHIPNRPKENDFEKLQIIDFDDSIDGYQIIANKEIK